MSIGTTVPITPVPPATPAAAVSLSSASELPALSSAEAHSTLAMISLAAPAHTPAARLPLEVVAVVDRSGSMGGPKMQTMKQTLRFLVEKGLQSGDSLSLVAFDDTVDTRLPLTSMDAVGKRSALEAVDNMQPGRTTNLSGGLLQGLDLLQRAPPPPGGSTRAVLLFTDGIANCGITSGPGILEAAKGAMAGGPVTTIFTFGFGEGHNEDMLRALSQATNGLYYFIDKVETIPQAFADCLGGLVAVVAQNATLVLTPAEGDAATIAHVHSSYKRTAAADGSGGVELSLGDIYADDEKDVMVQLSLPALPAPLAEGAGAGASPCLHATLRYYSVPTSRFESVSTTLNVARPLATPAQQPLNLKLEAQRMRVAAAEAMARAAQLADAGRLDEGRAELQRCRDATLSSPAMAAGGSEQCAALVADLSRVATGYESAREYERWGGKMAKMSAMSHCQQRSNHVTGGAYEKASKRASKAAWTMGPSSAPPPRAAAAAAGPPSQPAFAPQQFLQQQQFVQQQQLVQKPAESTESAARPQSAGWFGWMRSA